MRVLVVDGMPGPNTLGPAAVDTLRSRGHHIDRVELLAQGFDRFMSATERRVYHDEENLLTAETRASAALVGSADALLVITQLVAGAISPPTKSWFERVFIPGVSFTFTRSGRVTGLLDNLRRVGMIVDCPDGVDGATSRRSSTRSVLRGARLNAWALCRTTYCTVGPADDPAEAVKGALARW